MAESNSPRTPSFTTQSTNITAFSTPVLCPRTPCTPLDSLPTTSGKRHRDYSPVSDKRFKAENNSPRLCIELCKLERRVLFPCYIEKDLVKTGWIPFKERAEGECEAGESDEETVVQSQDLLSSQLERSIQAELVKSCTKSPS